MMYVVESANDSKQVMVNYSSLVTSLRLSETLSTSFQYVVCQETLLWLGTIEMIELLKLWKYMYKGFPLVSSIPQHCKQ